jgi:glycosyltransferase involved in cell wall biosynthesis
VRAGVKPGKTTVISNGIDFSRFKDRISRGWDLRKEFDLPSDSFLVGFVGRFNIYHKGIDDFLKTISMLPENYYGIMAGDGEDMEQVLKIISTYNLKKRIILLGSIENILFFYHAVDVFLFASRFESFGLVIIEAVACGVPVYSFKVSGGAENLVRKYATLYLGDRDCATMSRAIMKAKSGYASFKNKVLEQRTMAEQEFSWEQPVQQLIGIYTNLVNEIHESR